MMDRDQWMKKILEKTSEAIVRVKTLREGNETPADYLFLDFNPAFEDLFGVEPGSLVNRKLTEIGIDAPRNRFGWLDNCSTIAKDDGKKTFEYYQREQKRWYCVEVLSLEEDTFTAIFSDITQQKKEAGSSAEYMKYKTVSDRSLYGIAIADINGDILYTNSYFAEKHGYTPGELLGTNLSIFHKKKQLPVVERTLSDMMNKGTFGPEEVMHTHKNGREFPMLMSGVLIRDGDEQPKYLATTALDITERKLVAEKLKENEKKLRTITSAARDAIIMINSKGDVTFWNEAAHKLLGYSREEIMGQNLHHLIGTEELQREHFRKFPEFCRTGKGDAIGTTLELTAINKEGKQVPCELSLSSVKLDGKWSAVGILRDITERKIAEEALEREKEKALEASRAKSEFLANMSHELRTPLNGVIGFSEILQNTGLSKSQLKYTKIVSDSAKSLLSLINDILDFSKIEAGKLDLNPEKTDLHELLKSTLDVVKFKAKDKGIVINESLSERIPRNIYVDSVRLKQILLNLLSNAIKFTEEGAVTLMVRLKEVDSEKETMKLLFAVKDTGIGIKEASQKKIMEAFTQEDYSITRRFGGTGLGLAITKNLLHKMGATLRLESRVNQGSRFFFELTLPWIDKEPLASLEESADEKNEQVQPGSAKKKVLVVEDNEVNREFAASALNLIDEGLEIIHADNGKMAVEKFLSLKPDLIFMDIRLPDKDGYEITGMIRKLNAQVPVIALTAKAVKGERERCIAAGMNDYLTKPVSIDQIRDVIEKYLPGR